MKKALLIILMAGLILATVFSALSVSAIVEKEDSKLVGVGSSSGGGTVIAEVWYFSGPYRPEDATVYCVDVNYVVHIMEWGSYGPGQFAFIDWNVPFGKVDVTVRAPGYRTQTKTGTLVDDDRDALLMVFFLRRSFNAVVTNPANFLQNQANFLSMPQNLS